MPVFFYCVNSEDNELELPRLRRPMSMNPLRGTSTNKDIHKRRKDAEIGGEDNAEILSSPPLPSASLRLLL
jgi:hypothetical protein